MTGQAYSYDFPATPGAFQTVNGALYYGNAFVTKLKPDGTGLVYSTYLGGNYSDAGASIAVDPAGFAYITGGADSTNFPTTPGAFQTTSSGASAFVTKLNAAGSALVYSTFLGGGSGGYAHGYGIAIDSAGFAYVEGSTDSRNFPTTAGAFQTANKSTGAGEGDNAFVTKLTVDGSRLVYSTYLGGSGPHTAGSIGDRGLALAIDPWDNAYVTGFTESTDFPTTPGAFQTVNNAAPRWSNAFVTELNAAGSGLVYSTYLGGDAHCGREPSDEGLGIAVDSSGKAHLTGWAGSKNFPTTPGAFQTTNFAYYCGNPNGFVSLFSLPTPTPTATATETATPTATATTVPEEVLIVPPQVVFGRKEIGKTLVRPVLVQAKESNTLPVLIENFSVSAADFSLDAAKSTCKIGELLAAGQNCMVVVDFTPASYKSYSDTGTLTVTTDATTVSPSGGIVQLTVRLPTDEAGSGDY